METITCKNCNSKIHEDEIEVENTCPNCGKYIKSHHIKAEPGHYEVSINESFSLEIIRAVHMLYFELANEMAYRCKESKARSQTIKYSLGSVILSYTTIDSYLTNQINFNDKLKSITDGISKDKKREFDRLEIINKIEWIYLLSHKDNDSFSKGVEPLQSLEILKQLRNTAIHYEPFPESGDSIDDLSNKRTKNLAKRARSKFDFGDSQGTFLWACFSVGAAIWSFELIEQFISWFCTEFNLPKPNLKSKWELHE
jgi:phage FluMu protein Com